MSNIATHPVVELKELIWHHAFFPQPRCYVQYFSQSQQQFGQKRPLQSARFPLGGLLESLLDTSFFIRNDIKEDESNNFSLKDMYVVS